MLENLLSEIAACNNFLTDITNNKISKQDIKKHIIHIEKKYLAISYYYLLSLLEQQPGNNKLAIFIAGKKSAYIQEQVSNKNALMDCCQMHLQEISGNNVYSQAIKENLLILTANFYSQILGKKIVKQYLTNSDVRCVIKQINNPIQRIEIKSDVLPQSVPEKIITFLFDAVKFINNHKLLLLILFGLIFLPIITAQPLSRREEEKRNTSEPEPSDLPSDEISAARNTTVIATHTANKNHTFVQPMQTNNHVQQTPISWAQNFNQTLTTTSNTKATTELEQCSEYMLTTVLNEGRESATFNLNYYQECGSKLNAAQLTQPKHRLAKIVFNLTNIEWPRKVEIKIDFKDYGYDISPPDLSDLEKLETKVISIINDIKVIAKQGLKQLTHTENEQFRELYVKVKRNFLDYYAQIRLLAHDPQGHTLPSSYSKESITNKQISLYRQILEAPFYEEEDLETYCKLRSNEELKCLTRLHAEYSNNEYAIALLTKHYRETKQDDKHKEFLEKLLKFEESPTEIIACSELIFYYSSPSLVMDYATYQNVKKIVKYFKLIEKLLAEKKAGTLDPKSKADMELYEIILKGYEKNPFNLFFIKQKENILYFIGASLATVVIIFGIKKSWDFIQNKLEQRKARAAVLKQYARDLITITSIVTDTRWQIHSSVTTLSLASCKTNINTEYGDINIIENNTLKTNIHTKLLSVLKELYGENNVSFDQATIRINLSSLPNVPTIEYQIKAQNFKQFVISQSAEYQQYIAQEQQNAAAKLLSDMQEIIRKQHNKLCEKLNDIKAQGQILQEKSTLDEILVYRSMIHESTVKRCPNIPDVKKIQQKINNKITHLDETSHILLEKIGLLSWKKQEELLASIQPKLNEQTTMEELEQLGRIMIELNDNLNTLSTTLSSLVSSYKLLSPLQEQIIELVKERDELQEQEEKKEKESKPTAAFVAISKPSTTSATPKAKQPTITPKVITTKPKTKIHPSHHQEALTLTLEEYSQQKAQEEQNKELVKVDTRLKVAIDQMRTLENLLSIYKHFLARPEKVELPLDNPAYELFSACQKINLFENKYVKNHEQLFNLIITSGLAFTLMKSSDAASLVFYEPKYLMGNLQPHVQKLVEVRDVLMHLFKLSSDDLLPLSNLAKQYQDRFRPILAELNIHGKLLKAIHVEIDYSFIEQLRNLEKIQTTTEIVTNIKRLLHIKNFIGQVANHFSSKPLGSALPLDYLKAAEYYCIARIGELFSTLRKNDFSNWEALTEHLHSQLIMTINKPLLVATEVPSKGGETTAISSTLYENFRNIIGHQFSDEQDPALRSLKYVPGSELYSYEEISDNELKELRLITAKIIQDFEYVLNIYCPSEQETGQINTPFNFFSAASVANTVASNQAASSAVPSLKMQ